MKNTIFERVAAIGGDYKDITAKLLKEKEFKGLERDSFEFDSIKVLDLDSFSFYDMDLRECAEYDIEMYNHKKMKSNTETSLKVLRETLPILEAQEDFSNDALFARLSEYIKETGVKTGFVMWPLRTALSGKQSTPAGATEIMEVLGKEESLQRIKLGIDKLQ